ncbi:MAG: internal scaffolding protein [Microviridae sp.]|nr:MAG: internal scaffolding protein [Microviridae sp.]
MYYDPETGELLNVFFRSGFNYDRDKASLESGLDCQDPSRTQQQFAEDADINTIVRRFGITGKMPENATFPTYGDFTGISDYRTALDAINQADAEFLAIPAEVRARFDNDPQRFLEFCSTPDNLPAMREMGLAVQPAEALKPAAPAAPAQSST